MAGGYGGPPSWYDSDVPAPEIPSAIPVDIRTGDLYKFSNEVAQELARFATNWQEGIQPLFMAGAAAFGNNGEFHEPYYTRSWHCNVADVTSMFLSDVIRGIAAISTAAQTIAVEYNNGDVEGAEGFDAVFDSFYPADPKDSTNPPATEPDGDGGKGNDGSDNPADTDTKTKYDENPDPNKRPEAPEPEGADDRNVLHPGRHGEFPLDDPYRDVPDLDMGGRQ